MGFPDGSGAGGLATGLLVDGGSRMNLFFRSAGNRRGFDALELVSECEIGETVSTSVTG